MSPGRGTWSRTTGSPCGPSPRSPRWCAGRPPGRSGGRTGLTRQHTDAYELAVTLLHYVPEADRTRALRQLSTGELRRLIRLLAEATDLRQIARAIVADLQRHLHPERPMGGP
jgi:hypothetical protein